MLCKKMKGCHINNKIIKKTPQIKSNNAKNLFATYKKNYNINSKKKFFSISSKDDLIKNNLKKYLSGYEPNIIDDFKKTDRQVLNHNISTPKYISLEVSHNFKRYSTLEEKNDILKNKNNKKLNNLFRKNKFKKTIIIDNEGNNNLNLEKKNFKQSTSQKVFLLNSKNKIDHKYNNKQINYSEKTKNSYNCKNDNVKNIINLYKNNNFDTITSTFTETNSLFINSKNNSDRKEINTENILKIEEEENNNNNEIIDKEKDNKRLNEYNNIIDLLKHNIDDIKKMVNNNKNIDKNNDICDYTTFFKNIPDINNNYNNKENISNNNSKELISFLESSIQDDFYQSLLFKKSLKNNNDDSFNLNKSISEFDEIKNEKIKHQVERFIHLQRKNDLKINSLYLLNMPNQKNINIVNNKLNVQNIGKHINENQNNFCILY